MVLAALVVHAAILFGVRFQQSPQEVSPTQALRVALVRAPNLRRPEKTEIEAAEDHSGDDQPPPSVQELAIPAPQPVPELPPAPAPEITPPEPISVAEPLRPVPEEPEQTMIEPAPPTAPAAQPKPKIQVQPKPKLRAMDLIRQARQLAQLSVPEQPIDRDKADQGPSTKYSVREAYIRAWIRKVQSWGTRNFPEEARRKNLTGSLTLRVTLRHDGAVSEILLLRSSGHPVLDQAAKDIVELAAPYAPFPAELREQEGDYLPIRRTWQFMQGNRLKSN